MGGINQKLKAMAKNRNQVLDLRYVAGIGLAVLLLVFFDGSKSDLAICRQAFYGLTKGAYFSYDRHIAWERLQAVGTDVGAVYSLMPNDKERLNYRQAFFKSFAEGFRITGGRFEAFSNWRILEKDSQKTVVAADYRGKILLFTISKKYGRKISQIQWKE